MGRANRKKWLLLLWEYHNGGLRDAEIGEVDRRVAEDLKSRTDSERVLGIINELRQEGRWETHPEFPSQMVDRIIQMEGHGGKLRWLILLGAVVLVLLFLLFSRGDSAAQGVTGAFSQFRSVLLSFFPESPPFDSPDQFDAGRLRLEREDSVDLQFEEEWIPSASLDLDDGARPPSTFDLVDPVSDIEKEMDTLFEGGFAPAP